MQIPPFLHKALFVSLMVILPLVLVIEVNKEVAMVIMVAEEEADMVTLVVLTFPAKSATVMDMML